MGLTKLDLGGGGVIVRGVRDVWVEGVGEVAGGRADGEDRGSLKTLYFALLGEVQIDVGQSVKDVLC